MISGSIVALGGHDPIPDLVNPSASPITVQSGGTAIHTFELDNDAQSQRFDFIVTNTNDADFTYAIFRSGVPLVDTDADGLVDTGSEIGDHTQVEFELRVTADPSAPFLSETSTSVQAIGDKAGVPSNVVTFVTRVGEGGPVTFDKRSDDPDGRVLVGQNVTYIIDFANPYTTQTITDFMITDTLDADVTVDVPTISGGGIYDPDNHRIVWNSFGDLSPGQNGSVSYDVIVEVVPDQTQVTNTAVGDGSNVAAASDSVLLVVDAPTLSVFDKSLDDASPRPGDTITYSIEFEVIGSANLNNFTVTDTYDATAVQVTQISPSPASHDAVNGIIVWDLGTVTTGTVGTLFITGTVIGADDQTAANVAVATGDEIPPAQSSANFTVNAEANLAIEKVDLSDPVRAGDTLTYRVTVTNAGPNPAEDTQVTDDLPPGVTFISSTGPCLATAEGFECNLGAVSTSSPITFDFVVQLDPGIPTGTVLSNTVSVTSSTDDIDPTNNTATEDTTVIEESNLVVTKDDGIAQAVAGSTGHTYTITIYNAGPSNAEVVLTDDWPSAFIRTSLSCTPTGPPPLPNADFTCDLGVLGPDSTFTVTATYDIPASTLPGSYFNTATVAPIDSETSSTDNVEGDQTDVVIVFDLRIAKSDGPVAPVAGDGVTYTYQIVISNSGPSDAHGVVLADDWPSGFFRTDLSCAPVAGSPIGTGDFSCLIATISAGSSVTITADYIMPASSPAGIHSNVVTATAAGDVDTTNNSVQDNTAVIEEADLSITKDDGETTVVAGTAPYSYVVTISNSGPSDARDVTLTDIFPDGFTRGSVTGCTPDTLSDDFTCSLGTIPSGGSSLVTITYSVPSGTPAGTYLNTATVTTSATDPNLTNNSDGDSTSVTEETDLVVQKDDGVASVVAGTGPYTYTITVFNEGPSDATNVTLTDNWPAEFTRTSLSCDPADLTGDFTCTFPVIAASTTATVTATYTVPSDITAGSVTNTASATSTTETDPSDNTDSDVNQVIEETDLVVQKDDGVASVVAGTGPYTYTITIGNLGPSDATNVTLSDNWPAEFTRTSLSCDPADLTGDFTCTFPLIAAGTTATVIATYMVRSDTPAGSYTNTVVATSTTETDPADNTDADVTTVGEAADLVVVKDDGVLTVIPGTSGYTYTITIFNAGPSDARNVTISDDWPAEINRTSLSCVPTSGSATGTGDFACALGTIGAGTTATVTATYTVPSDLREGATVINTITATTSATETNPANNFDSDANSVDEQVDLRVAKSDGEVSVPAGTGPYAYTITIFNAGPSDAFDVTLEDSWPVELSRTSLSCDPADLAEDFTCTFPSIPAGTTLTVGATYVVPTDVRATIVMNEVTVTSSEETFSSDNSASDTTEIVEQSDLVVQKGDSADPVASGTGPYTYTITVFNSGPSDAYDVTLTDNWPGELTRTSLSCDPSDLAGDFTCDLGTIPAGSTATVTATFVVASDVRAGTVTNSVVATSSTETNPTDNDDDETTTIIEQTDLVVQKDDGVASVVAGTGPYTYTITIFNAGPSDAYNVTLADNWPAEFTRTSLSCDPTDLTGDFTCTFPLIAAGTTATVTATYTVVSGVSAGPVTNTVTATSTTETNPSNNTASDVNQVTEASDLVVSKDDGVTTLIAGEPAVRTYTITVFNAGPSDADSVALTDTWPPQFDRTSLSCTPTSGSATGTGDFTCNLGTIAAGTTATVTATYTVPSNTPAGDYANTATATSATETDPSDNTDSDVNTVTTQADLVVTKSDSPDPVAVLNGVTYTVTVTNQGLSDAGQVVLIDNLDNRTTYVTHTASDRCVIDAGLDTITCDLGGLGSGATFSFEIQVSVGILPDATVLSNVATATSSTPDPVTSNNTSTETTTVSAPVITLTKSASPASGSDVGPGEEIAYTITYRNEGTLTGTNFVITDTVSDAFGTPDIDDGGTYDPASRTIKWEIGSVDPGDSGTVSFSGQLGSTDRQRFIDNIATGTVTEMIGTISSNSTRHDFIPPDVLITKSANVAENSEVRALQVITYTLTIRNRSNVDALSVSVRDDPPAGMTYVPGTTSIDGNPVGDSGGTSPAFSGLNLGTIRRGETRSVSLQMQVGSGVARGQILENWGFASWNLGTQQSADFHHLRVLSRLSPPTLRMSILLQEASGETIFVTIFNRVVGLLVVTGYEAVLLLLLALGALGAGRSLAKNVPADLLRRMLK